MDSSATRRLAALLVMAFALTAPASAQEDERARRVFDIFKANCLECHGESRKGGLDLRTQGTLIKGGTGGRVVDTPRSGQKPSLPACLPRRSR